MYDKLGNGTAVLMFQDSLGLSSVWQTAFSEISLTIFSFISLSQRMFLIFKEKNLELAALLLERVNLQQGI